MMKNVPYTVSARAHGAGFSLIELMISITIGMLLIAGMATLVSNNSLHRQELDKTSRQIENGRYAMQILSDDLRHSGYYGQYYELAAVPSTMPDPCSTTITDIQAATPLAVQGYDAPSTIPTPLSACLSDDNHVDGTDILVVRRAATVTSSTLTAGRVYIQGLSNTAIINDGSADTSTWTLKKKDTTTPADIRQFVVHIYFISPCSVPAGGGSTCTGSNDDGGSPIPTLKRLELTNNGTARGMTIVPLVEGIENLQIDYGVDSIGTGTPNSYVTSPANVAAWGNVVAVNVHLIARNNEATPGFSDDKTYDMGLDGTYTPVSAVQKYKRHAYAQLVRLENPSARREQ